LFRLKKNTHGLDQIANHV